MTQLIEQVRALDAGVRRSLWLSERKHGIGASDAAAVLGLSPWRGPLDVWIDKVVVGQPEPRETAAMWWGKQLEEPIARRYALETGHALTGTGEELFRHPKHPMLIATPDRFVVGQSLGVECKNTARADGWGEPWTDQIPQHHVVQVVHTLSVVNFPAWDVAVLIGGGDFRGYRIYRDEQVESLLVERLLEWWDRHIVKGVRPDLDDSEGARRFVHDLFPRDIEPLVVAPPEAHGWAQRLAAARGALETMEAEKRRAETELKALIADRAGFTGEGWKATWKSTRGRTSVDWEAVAKEFGIARGIPPEEFALAIEKHTKEAAGIRRFVFTQD